MPKKNMTPEERKAWGEKMKAARLARQEVAPTPEPEVVGAEDLASLVKRVEELSAQLQQVKKEDHTTSPMVGARGIIGTYEKFSVNPAHYPDPRERLFEFMDSTPALRRFGFRDNYELQWEIETTNYQTLDGINSREPRFIVKLIGIIYDEDTYEKTDKRYIVRQLVFHEDPDAALYVARQHNLEVDESNPKLFLDEMRFLRVRDWLNDVFFPPKILPDTQNMREEVIGNTLVHVFTANSADKVSNIPFDKMTKKG